MQNLCSLDKSLRPTSRQENGASIKAGMHTEKKGNGEADGWEDTTGKVRVAAPVSPQLLFLCTC